MSLLWWLVANWKDLLLGVEAVLGALIALALILPGSEPEATLQKVLDFLKKFSRK